MYAVRGAAGERCGDVARLRRTGTPGNGRKVLSSRNRLQREVLHAVSRGQRHRVRCGQRPGTWHLPDGPLRRVRGDIRSSVECIRPIRTAGESRTNGGFERRTAAYRSQIQGRGTEPNRVPDHVVRQHQGFAGSRRQWCGVFLRCGNKSKKRLREGSKGNRRADAPLSATLHGGFTAGSVHGARTYGAVAAPHLYNGSCEGVFL